MTILSFYTTDSKCQVALLFQNMFYSELIDLKPPQTQATTLVSLIQKAWLQVNCPTLQVIIGPCGPGSFTTLRVLLAAAQGLKFVFPKAKVFSPTHLDTLAFSAHSLKSSESPVLALVDSKRGEWYGQVFHNISPLTEVQIFNPQSLWEFMSKNPHYRISADFKLDDLFIPYLSVLPLNLALSQINLYQKIRPSLEKYSQEFTPYYFHYPAYVKKKQGFP